jgi:hypothetical protein
MVNQIRYTQPQDAASLKTSYDRFRRKCGEFKDKLGLLLPRIFEAIKKIFFMKEGGLFIPVEKGAMDGREGLFPFDQPLVKKAVEGVKKRAVKSVSVQNSVCKRAITAPSPSSIAEVIDQRIAPALWESVIPPSIGPAPIPPPLLKKAERFITRSQSKTVTKPTVGPIQTISCEALKKVSLKKAVGKVESRTTESTLVNSLEVAVAKVSGVLSGHDFQSTTEVEDDEWDSDSDNELESDDVVSEDTEHSSEENIIDYGLYCPSETESIPRDKNLSNDLVARLSKIRCVTCP